jgi:CTD small phosphatase-like protein 2
LEQELNPDEESTPLSVSSLTGSDWTEACGDSETMEFYDATSSGVFDPATKVLQKYREDQEQFWFMCSVIQRNNEQPMSEEETLLPPRNPKDTRKTLVLDLDETLVHCFLDYEEDTTYDWTFQVDSENGLFDVFCRVRPHLEEFLKECAKMFELVLFTASQDNYANKVLDHVDPAGYIQHRLFRRHCTKVRGNFVKDLSRLGRKLDQTIIIDNSPLTFAFQPLNGIPCDNWFDDQMDQELLQLLPILRHLKAVKDVREELAEIYYVERFLSGLRYSIAMAEECDWMCVETLETC